MARNPKPDRHLFRRKKYKSKIFSKWRDGAIPKFPMSCSFCAEFILTNGFDVEIKFSWIDNGEGSCYHAKTVEQAQAFLVGINVGKRLGE